MRDDATNDVVCIWKMSVCLSVLENAGDDLSFHFRVRSAMTRRVVDICIISICVRVCVYMYVCMALGNRHSLIGRSSCDADVVWRL